MIPSLLTQATPATHLAYLTPHFLAFASGTGINYCVQFELLFGPRHVVRPEEVSLLVGTRPVRLCFVRNRRARRYILRLRPDAAARVTIPGGGSVAEAKRFVEKNVAWLEQQLLRQATQPVRPERWLAGTEILFRGEHVRLETESNGETGLVRFGSETVRLADVAGDLRPPIERHLRQLAARELPLRVFELGSLHRLRVRHVTVRNQRSRWGSCSPLGTMSLNWRLIQAPVFVRDYIVLHELAHIKEMNHSHRFWSEVARLCPDFTQAERWLKAHAWLLRRSGSSSPG